MTTCYLFFRCWPGYAPNFEYESFNDLPDDEIGSALEDQAHAWIEDHEDEWSNRSPTIHSRASRQDRFPRPGEHWYVQGSMGSLMYEVGLVSKQIKRLPASGARTPGKREFFHRVESEDAAKFAVVEMQRRCIGDWLNPRFGFVSSRDLSSSECAAAEVEITDILEESGYPGSMGVLREEVRTLAREYAGIAKVLDEAFLSVDASTGSARENPVESVHVLHAEPEAVCTESKMREQGTVEAVGGVFRRPDETWELAYGAQNLSMPHLEGFRLIHALLRHEGRSVDVSDLVGDATAQSKDEPIFDREGVESMEQRILELDDCAQEAKELGKVEVQEDAEKEKRRIEEELKKNRGLGNRIRPMGSDVEKRRKKVGSAIKVALKKIETKHPELHAHLKASIHRPSGHAPCYQPSRKVVWTLD